ncbi:MAG: SurA N-terminal domain-containing protein [Bacteroidales bacterium]|nr:SurA N-terminal domain-containing protein [Bacteroidales bacterium]
MAVLETIRVKLGVLITVLIAVALLSFIIDPTTLSNVSSAMSSKNDVGVIGGKSVSYLNFDAKLKELTDVHEYMTGQSAQNEQAQLQVRNEAWQYFADKNLFIPNIKSAGFVLGKDEQSDMIFGENPSPMIYQLFFDRNTGAYNPDNVYQFYANKNNSPIAQSFWNYIVDQATSYQYYSKYSALLSKTFEPSSLMSKKLVEETNTTYSVDFVTVPFGIAPDTTIQVTNEEIKAYYNANADMYKRLYEQREIEYIVFEATPSQSDIDSAAAKFARNFEDFSTTDDIESFFLRGNVGNNDGYYYKDGEASFSKNINDFIFNNNGVAATFFQNGLDYEAVRILDEKSLPDSVKVNLFICANASADSAMTEINAGAKFEEVSAKFAAREDAVYNDWMNQAMLSANNLIGLMEASVNTVTVVSAGLENKIVAKVEALTKPVLKKKVATYELTTLASQATINAKYFEAKELASLAAGKYKNYQAVLDTNKVLGAQNRTETIEEATRRLASVDDARAITRWAFEAKKGEVSDVLTVNTYYFFVAALKDVKKAGKIPVQEVASSIQTRLYAEKQAEKAVADVTAKIQGCGTIEAVAEALNASVSHSDAVAFTYMNSQGLDPKFIGAVTSAEQGKLSAPISGGTLPYVYVFTVTGKETGAFYDEDSAARMMSSRVQQKANPYYLMGVMSQDAEVIDNRARFY